MNRKLLYADSTIITAIQNKNDDDISRAYLGKGIIYYYNRRQYKPALEQYLIAFKFSKNSKDDYLKNKITYHLGMVKSYLGYYKEAAVHFEEAADYFEKKSKENVHPNIRLNNESGYFNSIYRLSTCYRNLRLYQKEDSLINIGLRRLHNTAQLSTEYGYFQKGKGVQLLRLGNTDDALQYFKQSKDILSHHQDDASLMTVYFYMGKAYWSDRKRAESLQYLNKVDSLVNKFWFVTPEIRSGYEYLIKDAKQNKNYERQLYYTNQLLKADSIINADFAMLSSKIHREYDTNTLLEEKNKLQRVHKNGFIILYYSMGFGLMILCFSIWKFRKREKALTIKYQELLEKFNTSQPTDHFLESKPVSSEEKNIYSAEIIEEVKANLKIFEERKNFLKQNLTLPIVAKMIGSNRTHLSYVLNVHLDVTFTTYLKILRIRYITNLLLEDSKYLKFKIDSLAEKCGMANRQIFSAHFLEINGIRPTDFIRKRLDEIQKN
ncbi:helix-turn-helix domain-containing protein [Chryseobacterium sp. POE27]|uniref:helix-turn-helix domain-containing protein n=1 Tax=Chryseobacterium sp. POE27 TaxID=3138177 RepID=UPI00321BF48F